MKAIAKVQNPSSVNVTIEITMSVQRWHELRSQLADQYPSWAFAALIGNVIDKSLRQVESSHEAESV